MVLKEVEVSCSFVQLGNFVSCTSLRFVERSWTEAINDHRIDWRLAYDLDDHSISFVSQQTESIEGILVSEHCFRLVNLPEVKGSI